MPAPRGPDAKHERNLQRNLDVQPPRAESAHALEGEAADTRNGNSGVAAKLARDAAEREAVRRASERGVGRSEER